MENNITTKIFAHYQSEMNKRRIEHRQFEEYIADENKYHDCIKDTEQRLKIKLKDGVCSKMLIHQLARHRCNLGEAFNEEGLNSKVIEYYSTSEILDVIEFIELEKMKGNRFDSLPLKGLYKIHHGGYSTGYSIVKNINNFWFDNEGIIKNKRQKDFNEIISKYGSGDLVTIANQMHSKAIYSRKLTGEWIIYAIHDNRKYYMCLAMHNEGDANIFEHKIKLCYQEFPELQN